MNLSKGRKKFYMKSKKGCDKPTHKTIISLIKSMRQIKGDWFRADNPNNIPQLYGFVNTSNANASYFTINATILDDVKIKPKNII